MAETHYRSCTLSEATCGVAIDVEGDRVVAIRGFVDELTGTAALFGLAVTVERAVAQAMAGPPAAGDVVPT